MDSTAIALSPFEQWFGCTMNELHRLIENRDWLKLKEINNVYHSNRKSFSYNSYHMKMLKKRAEKESLYIVVSDLTPCGQKLFDDIQQNNKLDYPGYVIFLIPTEHMMTRRGRYGMVAFNLGKHPEFVNALSHTFKDKGIRMSVDKIVNPI